MQDALFLAPPFNKILGRKMIASAKYRTGTTEKRSARQSPRSSACPFQPVIHYTPVAEDEKYPNPVWLYCAATVLLYCTVLLYSTTVLLQTTTVYIAVVYQVLLLYCCCTVMYCCTCVLLY